MKTMVRKMGNSQGVLLPKVLLAQLGIAEELDMTVEGNAIVLRKPSKHARAGWADASKALAAAGDDALTLPEFANADDDALTW